LMRVRGIGPIAASRLFKAGIKTINQIANSTPTELAFVKGIGVNSAKKIISNAQHLMTLEKGLTIVLDHIKVNFIKQCPKCGGEMKEKFIILGPERRLSAYQCDLCKFYLPQ
ncbi:MAG: helix-hairpin-helix domain-containing protein, partial [Promethearchaeota archaeon]